jgi:hypothetical protein
MPGYAGRMASESDLSFGEFVALSPNERAEIMQAGIITSWNELDADEQARLVARAAELRPR